MSNENTRTKSGVRQVQKKSGIKNRVPEISAPFVKAFGPEITDKRLSWSEKGLLWWLRFRAATNGSSWMSWETIAEDFGESLSVIEKRAKKLRDLGWLECESRGFAATKMKILSPPSDHYDEDLLCNTYEYLRHDRSNEEVLALRSEGNDDEHASEGQEHSESPYPHDHTGHTPTNVGAMSLQDYGQNVDEVEGDESESDTRFARNDRPTQVGHVEHSDYSSYDSKECLSDSNIRSDTTAYDKSSYNSSGVENKESNNGQDSGIPSRAASAAASVSSRISQTRSVEKREQAKRQKRKTEREQSGEAERVRSMKATQKETKKTVGKKMYEYFKHVFEDSFPRYKFHTWLKEDYGKAYSFYRACGEDLDVVKRCWKYACDNWEKIRIDMKLDTPYPTIGWMLSFRDRIIPMSENTVSSRAEVEGGHENRGKYDL